VRREGHEVRKEALRFMLGTARFFSTSVGSAWHLWGMLQLCSLFEGRATHICITYAVGQPYERGLTGKISTLQNQLEDKK